MSEVKAAGTMFDKLITELKGLIANPNVSKIEVVMASPELDDRGQIKMVGGKDVVALRPFAISGVNKEVEEQLRKEFYAQPISVMMVLYADRVHQGIKRISFASDKGRPVELEKAVFRDYVERQSKELNKN